MDKAAYICNIQTPERARKAAPKLANSNPFKIDSAGFPECPTGDVLIVLAPDRRFKLHSDLLRIHSTFFAQGISKDNAATLNKPAIRDGMTIRWRFDMTDRPMPQERFPGTLTRTELNSRGHPATGAVTAAIDLCAGKVPNPVYTYYYRIFAAIYGKPIEVDDTATVSLVTDVEGLLYVSEYLGCLNAVSKTLEASLLAGGQKIWHCVAFAPVPWAQTAMRINSACILQEALIHIVGKWNELDKQVRENLEEPLWPIVESKRKMLTELCQTAERRMLSWYPTSLTRKIDASGHEPNRSSYSNDVYIWMALSVFRQYICAAFQNNEHHTSKDGGYAFYRRIGDGNYLGRSDLEGFFNSFAMSSRGKTTIRTHIEMMQNHVKRFVAPLLKNEAQIDMERFQMKHFTCIKITKEDVLPALATSRQQYALDAEMTEESSSEEGDEEKGDKEGDHLAEGEVEEDDLFPF